MEKPWKLISNADGIDDDFATLDEALKAADEKLALWRDQARDDGEWDEEVEGVEIHLVTHAARIVSRDGDNEDDGVEYGITEILGNEIDEELRQLRADLCDAQTLNESQTYNAECAVTLAQKYKDALEQIVATGDSDSNFPQDGRMYDIAKAALSESV